VSDYGLPQCGSCRPPSDYYCEYKCLIARQAREEQKEGGGDGDIE